MIAVHLSPTPDADEVRGACEAFRQAGWRSYARRADGASPARLACADVVLCHDAWPACADALPVGRTLGWSHTGRAMGPADAGDGLPWGVSAGRRETERLGCPVLPELVPHCRPLYRPVDKPADRVAVLCCLPAGAGAGDEAYEVALAALAGLNADVDVLCGPPGACGLRRLARAHMVVDLSVPEGAGRVSFEALALACTVFNPCSPTAGWQVQRLARGRGHPFVATPPEELGEALRDWIDLGPAAVAHAGRRNRAWLARNWEPGFLIETWILPLPAGPARAAVGGNTHATRT